MPLLAHPRARRRLAQGRLVSAPLAVLSTLAVVASGLLAAAPAQAVSSGLVISRVYGGGGNAGAPFTNDYIEVFNRGSVPVSTAGLSVQYASAAGTTWAVTPLGTRTVPAGGSVLVQEAGGTTGAALPAPDVLGTINLSATNGKVALVSSTTALGCGVTCAAAAPVVDFIGFGTANDAEGAPAPAPSNTTEDARAAGGCTDTDVNAADFATGAPAPRTSATTPTPCGGPPVDTAPTVTSTAPGANATGVPIGSNVAVTFSEPVAVTDNAFSLSCTSSGAHTVTRSGGPTTYTLDPTSDFAIGEDCTLSVAGAEVTDTDGTPDHAADFSATFSTEATDPCTAAFTHTYEIQGSGTASPLVGQSVTTEGVVTADFQGPGQLSGFALQDEQGDGDVATSDGVFVFGSAAPQVAVGDVVRVTGRVQEFRNQTEVSFASGSLVRCGAVDPPAPTVVHLPETVNGDLEHFEGMLVRVAETLTVQQNFFLGRFGQLTLGAGGRRSQPTNVFPAGSTQAQALADENARSLLVLDDAAGGQNPIPTPYLDAANTRRAGDNVSGVTGMLDEGPINTSTTTDLDYRIEPTTAPTFHSDNPRTTAPAPVGGNLKVAFFNVLNYFTTFTTVDPNARGADNQVEFDRQRTKIFAAMSAIDADVLGLSEIENLPGTNAVQNLVDGLNAYVGDPGRYAAVADPPTGTGTDAIKVALIYRTSAVTPVGASISDPDPVNNRPPLAQEFRLDANGETVNVLVNHLKSKGSCPATGTDPGNEDSGDGQGCWNALRVRQAQRLLQFVDQVKASSGDPDVLAIGDFNSYGREDPIEALTAAGLVNEIGKHVGNAAAYSFVFDGLSGYLDHALTTPSADAQVVGAEEWHINADEPSVIDYNTDFKTGNDLFTPTPYRSSDHDPVVLGVDLGRCQFADDDAHHVRTLLGDCTTSETVPVPDGWTLDGAGHSITAYDPRGGHFRGAVVANAGRVANVHDLTVQARPLADVCDAGADRLRGILLDGASGVLHHNSVVGLAQSAPAGSGCQEGNAIEVRNEPFGPGGHDVLVTVTDNTVRGYQKGGIVLNGSVSGVVLGNTVQGLGRTPIIAQNGVQVAFAATALVDSNTISDNFYTGTADAQSCGVLFFQADQDSKQRRNTFSNNQRDVCNVN